MPSICPRASRGQAEPSGSSVDGELEARRARVEHDCEISHEESLPQLPGRSPATRRLKLLPSGMGREQRHGAAPNPRSHAVGAAGQDDGHPRAEDETRAVRVGQEA